MLSGHRSCPGNELPHRLYVARKDGTPVAAVLESTAPDGYSGNIQLLVAADFNRTVLGSRVTEHKETRGWVIKLIPDFRLDHISERQTY